MRFSPLGDRAVVIEVGSSIDVATHRRVRAICARLDEYRVPGMIEYVPAFASVVVHYDPARVPRAPAHTGDSDIAPTSYARMVAVLRTALSDMRDRALPPAA